MKKIIVLCLFALLLQLTSQAKAMGQDSCWAQESYKEQGGSFTSKLEWEQVRKEWNNIRSLPHDPRLVLKAYHLAKAETKKAGQLGGDKMAHCYMGCRIAQETDYETARFAAWYKEMKDLTDCNPNTAFEYADYAVTCLGAELRAATPEQCVQQCGDYLLPRY